MYFNGYFLSDNVCLLRIWIVAMVDPPIQAGKRVNTTRTDLKPAPQLNP